MQHLLLHIAPPFQNLTHGGHPFVCHRRYMQFRTPPFSKLLSTIQELTIPYVKSIINYKSLYLCCCLHWLAVNPLLIPDGQRGCESEQGVGYRKTGYAKWYFKERSLVRRSVWLQCKAHFTYLIVNQFYAVLHKIPALFVICEGQWHGSFHPFLPWIFFLLVGWK